MERVLKSQVPLLICALLTSNYPIATLAQNAPVSGTGDARRREVAYLTPMVDLEHSRNSAQASYQAMQFAADLPQYQNLCQSTAANARDFYWLGQTLFHLNRYPEAAQAFEREIAMNPRADEARIPLVQSYLGSNQPQLAKQKCSEALSIVSDPQSRQQLTTLEQFCQNRAMGRTPGLQMRSGRRLVE